MQTDYGTCPNGCTVRVTNDGRTYKEYAAPMRKRGHAVICNKCGYSVNRAHMIMIQRKGASA